MVLLLSLCGWGRFLCLSHPLPQQCSGGTQFLALTLNKETRCPGSHKDHLRTGMLQFLGCRSPQWEHPPAPGVTVPVTFLQSPNASGVIPGVFLWEAELQPCHFHHGLTQAAPQGSPEEPK